METVWSSQADSKDHGIEELQSTTISKERQKMAISNASWKVSICSSATFTKYFAESPPSE